MERLGWFGNTRRTYFVCERIAKPPAPVLPEVLRARWFRSAFARGPAESVRAAGEVIRLATRPLPCTLAHAVWGPSITRDKEATSDARAGPASARGGPDDEVEREAGLSAHLSLRRRRRRTPPRPHERSRQEDEVAWMRNHRVVLEFVNADPGRTDRLPEPRTPGNVASGHCASTCSES